MSLHSGPMLLLTHAQKSPEWNDPQAERDMDELIRVRDAVLVLLEQPRRAK